MIERRRHQLGKFGDEDLFRRVADMRRVVDHQRLRVDAIEHVRRGDIGEIERRVLAQQHHVECGKLGVPRLAEREVVSAWSRTSSGRTVADTLAPRSTSRSGV